jgi:hypothetical protein
MDDEPLTLNHGGGEIPPLKTRKMNDKKFKYLVLYCLEMILYWVAWRMDKLDSKNYVQIRKEINEYIDSLKEAD